MPITIRKNLNLQHGKGRRKYIYLHIVVDYQASYSDLVRSICRELAGLIRDPIR